MNASTSPEQLWQQVALLQKELKECRQTKDRLQSSELKYRNLVESANEAILVAQEGIFQYANPKAEALFGYSLKELTSKSIFTLPFKRTVRLKIMNCG